MASKKKTTEHEPTLEERAREYCTMGEEAAFYMAGLADAFELIGNEQSKNIVHRLRVHSSQLTMETLFVKYGYRVVK